MRSCWGLLLRRLPVFVSAALMLTLVLSFAPATRADDPESPPHAPSFAEAPVIKRPMVGMSTPLTFVTTGPDVTTACQWQEGGTGSVGASWANIPGATSCSSYTPASSLANAWLRAKVPATNAHGDVTALSQALRVNGELLVSSNVNSAWGWNLGLRLYDGSSFRRLTSGSTYAALGDYEPSASEDGTLIVFSSKRTGSNGQDLYLTTPTGSPVVRLTDYAGDERAPAFSPDANFIAYSNSFGELRRISLVDGVDERLSSSGGLPAWSYDGAAIAWIRQLSTPQHVKDYHQNTGTTDYYTQAGPCTNFNYYSHQTCWAERIPYVLYLDGRDPEMPFRSPSTVDATTYNENKLYYGEGVVWPSWSFDGTKLAAASVGDGRLRVYDLAAGAVTILNGTGGSTRPAWTRDGKLVHNDGAGLVRRDVDGMNPVTLTTTQDFDPVQVWLPEPLPALPLGQTFGDELAANPSDRSDVNSATGNFSYATTDLELPGFDLPFHFTRVYNSLDTSGGLLGTGWQHSLGAGLTIQGNGDVVARASDGQQLSFIKQLDGSYRPYVGGTAKLVKETDGAYRLTTDLRRVYLFDAAGKLTTLRSPNSHEISLDYTGGTLTSFTDAAGRSIAATVSSGRLTRLQLADGRHVDFGYDGSGRLTTVTDLVGKVWTYAYDGSSSRLASIKDPRDNWVVRNSYDSSSGRVTSQLDPKGGQTTWSWNADAQTATVTDQAGKAWKDVYKDNVLLQRVDPAGKRTRYRYDSEFNLDRITDGKGSVAKLVYDDQNRLIGRKAPAPLNYTETWTYNDLDLVTSHTDARGNTVVHEYDSRGNRTKTTEPGNRLTTSVVNADGLVTSSTNARGKTTTYTYDAAGNRTSATTPEGANSAWAYDAYGRVTAIVKPRGNVTGATPANYTRSFTYDAADRKLTETDELGKVTTFAYDDAGNLRTVTNALNKAWTYDYDQAGRRTKETGPNGATVELAYDVRGNVTEEIGPLGHKATHGYDDLNRRIWTVSPRGNVAGADAWRYKTQFEHDALGNIVKTTDPLGHATEVTRDVLGRATKVVYRPGTLPEVGYRGAVLPDAPAAYWRLGDSSGTAIAAQAGPAGTYVSGPTLGVTGATVGNTAVDFSAGSSYAKVANDSSINVADDSFTLEFWYSFDGTSGPGTSSRFFVVKGVPGHASPYYQYGVGTTTAGKFLAVVDTGGGYGPWDTGVTIPTTGWHHVVMTYDGALPANDWKLYLDGTLVAQTTKNGNVVPRSSALGLAAMESVIATYGYSHSYRLPVKLDEVAVHPGGISATRVQAHHGAADDAVGGGGGGTPAAARTVATYAYDANGNLSSITDAANGTTSASYDPWDRPTSVTDPRGKTMTFAYDDVGNLVSRTSHLGFKATFGYDGDDRRIWDVSPRGNVAGGTPNDFKTIYEYDADGNLVARTDPLGHEMTWAYDRVGRRTSQTDAAGHMTSWTYDDIGRLATVVDAAENETAYGYDDVSNLTSRTDAKGHVTEYGYDLARRLTTLTRPGASGEQTRVWSYAYDAENHLTKRTDANGNATASPTTDGITTVAYDPLGRPTTVDYADSTPDVAFTYDDFGNRASMADGQAANETYSYDDLNRLTAVTRGSDTYSYQYDPAGNVTKRTLADATVLDYTYDDDGRMATAKVGGSTVATYGYNADGLLTATTLATGNGYVETRTYDRAGRLTEVRNRKTADDLSFFTYTRDEVGNPTQIDKVGGAVERYEYDELHRITEVCYQAADCTAATDPYIRWSYDEVSNRTTETRPAGTTTYSYDNADRLTSETGPGGTIGYAYDENGNRTQKDGRTFAYDLADRLASTTAGGTTITYAYDGDGKRLEQAVPGGATIRYSWDRNHQLPQLALERNASSGALVRRYHHGLDLISMSSGGADYYFHPDGLGSVANLTNASGATQWTYAYEPYGALRNSTQNDPAAPTNLMRFTGELLDAETQLYHLRARQYDPANGSFLSTDPVAPAVGDPYVAAYVYVNQRPGVLVDPSGLFGWGTVRTWGHGALDAVGIIDPFGVADGLNALWYLAEGDRVNAAISAAALLPYVGDTAKAARYVSRTARVIRSRVTVAQVASIRAASTAGAATRVRAASATTRRARSVAAVESMGARREFTQQASSSSGMPVSRRSRDYVDFAHGTSREHAHAIIDRGLDAGAIRSAEFGSREPGSFFTVRVDPDDRAEAIETALFWGQRHTKRQEDACVIVCRLPVEVVGDLERAGSLRHDIAPRQSVFRPDAFPTVNANAQWLWAYGRPT
jgi:RHS repeat-associated protein